MIKDCFLPFLLKKKRIIKKRNCFGWVIKLQGHKACKLVHDQCMEITRWRSKNFSYLFTMSRNFNRDSRKTCFAGEMKHDNKLIKTINSTSQYTSYTLLIMSLPSNPDMVQPKRVLERKPTLQYFREGFFFLWQDPTLHLPRWQQAYNQNKKWNLERSYKLYLLIGPQMHLLSFWSTQFKRQRHPLGIWQHYMTRLKLSAR